MARYYPVEYTHLLRPAFETLHTGMSLRLRVL